MPTIAFVGLDGSGKSTVVERLQNDLSFPTKTLYMGVSLESTNVALPTSRLIRYLKRRKSKESTRSLEYDFSSSKRRFSGVRAVFRLTHRLLEEVYRQFLSWKFQRKGFVVLYDRHFLFDFHGVQARARFTDRLHYWFLSTIYPRPDLVIFLDAPAEVLLARKKDNPREFLEWRQEQILDLGKQTANFKRIDTTQPLEEVYEEVKSVVEDFVQSRAVRNS